MNVWLTRLPGGGRCPAALAELVDHQGRISLTTPSGINTDGQGAISERVEDLEDFIGGRGLDQRVAYQLRGPGGPTDHGEGQRATVQGELELARLVGRDLERDLVGAHGREDERGAAHTGDRPA